MSPPTQSCSYAVAGGEHTLHKSIDGSLTSAGACGLGWCRLQSLNPSLFTFRPVRFKKTRSTSHPNADSKLEAGSLKTDSDTEPVSLVHASYYHNLAVGKYSGLLYSWGCGTFTEGGMDGVIPSLGQGMDAKDVGAEPQVVNLNLPKAEWIKGITGGAYHSAVLLNTGRVLTFGANQLGQLGRPIQRKEGTDNHGESGDASGLPVDPTPSEAFVNDPDATSKMDPSPSSSIHIDKIGAGFYNTFAICSKGKLFCAGENQNQQCGAGPKNLHAFTPVIEVNDEVTNSQIKHYTNNDGRDKFDRLDQVEGGYCHTLVKTLAGKVLSLGCGDDGQRGDGRLGDDPNRPILTPIDLPNHIGAKQVAAGANHSVILGTDGNAYTFGANDVGQCGVPSDPHPRSPRNDSDEEEEEDWDGVPILAPKRVKLPLGNGETAGVVNKVVHVSAGYAHTVLTMENGETYVFGQNDNGQLGLGVNAFEEQDARTSPVKI